MWEFVVSGNVKKNINIIENAEVVAICDSNANSRNQTKKLVKESAKFYEDIDELDEDIKNHEPIDALNGGVDGFSKIRLVIEKSSNLIRKNGKVL